MADLASLAVIEAELAATADYDITLDVSKAKRRVAALRRKLDFPQSTGRGEQNIAFAMQAIENQLQQVLAWIALTGLRCVVLNRTTGRFRVLVCSAPSASGPVQQFPAA